MQNPMNINEKKNLIQNQIFRTDFKTNLNDIIFCNVFQSNLFFQFILIAYNESG